MQQAFIADNIIKIYFMDLLDTMAVMVPTKRMARKHDQIGNEIYSWPVCVHKDNTVTTQHRRCNTGPFSKSPDICPMIIMRIKLL